MKLAKEGLKFWQNLIKLNCQTRSFFVKVTKSFQNLITLPLSIVRQLCKTSTKLYGYGVRIPNSNRLNHQPSSHYIQPPFGITQNYKAAIFSEKNPLKCTSIGVKNGYSLSSSVA